MKSRRRGLALGLLLPLLAVLAAPALAGESPKLLAVKFHADWCGTCQRMGTTFEDVRAALASQPVLFIELDRTNQATSNQAALHAAALDLGKIWDETPGTGFVLLVDPATDTVVGKLTADQSVVQMSVEIERQLDQRAD